MGSEKTPNWRGRFDGCGGVAERGVDGVTVAPSWEVGRDTGRVEGCLLKIFSLGRGIQRETRPVVHFGCSASVVGRVRFGRCRGLCAA